MKYFGSEKYVENTDKKAGVLIINLGSPDAPDTSSVRSYLKQFLADPRVVEVPRLIWWLILNLVILRIRPARSAKNYRKVWTDQGSPLLFHTRAQEEQIQKYMDQSGQGVRIYHAMRYGNPSMESVLKQMQIDGVERIVILPLYPQYSCSTTGSVFDELANVLQTFRWVPELRFINQYFEQPEFIDACVAQIKNSWSGSVPDKIILSYHGTPIRYREKGDPYYKHCMQTSELITQSLVEKYQLKPEQIQTTFQSRFGREPWLQPYTDDVLTELANSSDYVQVFCPGFASDCLETLEEIAMESREVFESSGGKKFEFVPCLNASELHIKALSTVLNQQLTGWV